MITSYIETKEEFAANIKFIRESLGFPQWKVASELKVERSTYAYYEIGKTEISVFQLIELESIFSLCIEDLIAKDINVKFRALNLDKEAKLLTRNRGVKREYVRDKKELAENLRFFRTSNDLKQYRVAKRLFIDRSTYSYYETGKTKPKLLMLIKISNIFNIEFLDLILRRDAALLGIDSKKTPS